MKKDIEGRKDIETLVNLFYDKVRTNDLLGRIFDEIMKVDWDKHLAKMYNFWENILYQNGAYRGFPFTAHVPVNEKENLTPEHFDIWLNIFNETADELFTGEKTEELKRKAQNIKLIWSFKMEQINKNLKAEEI